MSRDLPGTNGNYLDIGDTAASDITGTALTIAAWVFPDTITGNHWIVAKDDVAPVESAYRLTIQSSKAACLIADGSSYDQAVGTTNVSTTAWSHVAGRKDGTGADALRVFLNGVSDGATTSNRSIQNAAKSLRIGNRDDNDTPFDGRIAKVAIWNVALSDAEILLLAAGYEPTAIQAANLRGYWPLAGSASPEPDTSGNGNNATIVGTIPAGADLPVKTGTGSVGLAGSGAKAFTGTTTKTGLGAAALTGTGTSESLFAETGLGRVGLTAAGASAFISPIAKSGYGKVGTAAAGDSAPAAFDWRGVSIGLGQTMFTKFVDWTRIDT